MEATIRELFERYEAVVRRALGGELDTAAAAALYATDFIAATPAGVMSGKNDAALIAAMAQGYDAYRAMGTQAMVIRDIRVTAIDDMHATVHVGWTATYARADLPRTEVAFDVHYLVQVREGQARVFGWVAGDEQALLRQRGIV